METDRIRRSPVFTDQELEARSSLHGTSAYSPSRSGGNPIHQLHATARPPPCDGELLVTVLRCDELVPADWSYTKGAYTSSDPYVKLQLGAIGQEEERQTKVVSSHLAPSFDETFSFPITCQAREHVLRVHVWDYDTFSFEDDFLGELVMRA